MFPSESAGSDFEQFWGDNAYMYFRGEYSREVRQLAATRSELALSD